MDWLFTALGALLIGVVLLTYLCIGVLYAIYSVRQALSGWIRFIREAWQLHQTRREKEETHTKNAALLAATYLRSSAPEHRGFVMPTILSPAGQHDQQSTVSPGELSLREHREIQADYADFRRALTTHAERNKVHFGRVEQIGIYLTLLDARREKLQMLASSSTPSREEDEEVQG